jgi:phage-related protein
VARTVEPLSETVEEEILALPADMQARLLWIEGLIADFGPQRVGMPHVRPLGGKLWEMRLAGKAGIGRVIYVAASRQRLVLLHAFVKKTEKTPRRAIALAQSRMKEVKP